MSWRKTGSPRPTAFPVHDFVTDEQKTPFAFKMWHDPHDAHPARTDNELVEFMKPQLLRVRRDILTDDELEETRVFELCDALFAEDELAPPQVVKDWILRLENGLRHVVPLPVKRSLLSGTSNIDFHFELDSIFYIVRLYNAPIAFAYLSYHRESRIVIANYIGVGNGWRSGGVAEKFISAIETDFQRDYPAARGLLFAIEPVDFDLITKFLDDAERTGRRPLPEQHPVYEHIRRFRRLEFYRGRVRASVYLDAARRPLIYTELCLDIEAAPEEWRKAENDYWLLWRPTAQGGPPPTWEEVVNVMCIEVNARSIVYRHPDRTGAAYWRYANDLARRNVQRAQHRDVVPDTLPVNRIYSRLVKIVENYREIAI
jgi:hypothetical protein